MDFEKWEPYYIQILKDFGYDRGKDEESARLLDATLAGDRISTRELERMIAGQEVFVAGNAASLKDELGSSSGLLIAADEAASVVMRAGEAPDIVVTDLDGDVKDQIKANVRGAVAVIHAHGDNMAAVRRWAPLFRGRVVATTQASPFVKVHNFGGFTDGDRAVFLAHHFRASRIRLLGFDFVHPSPKDERPEVKIRKLAWAKRLIEELGVI